jgi:hypothetical protein
MCRHAPLHVNRVVVKPVVKLSVNSDMARVLAKILGDLSSERLRNFSDDLAVADSPVHRRDTPYWRDLLEKASGWTITPHHRLLVAKRAVALGGACAQFDIGLIADRSAVATSDVRFLHP